MADNTEKTPQVPTDKELVRSVLSGDTASFDLLVERYQRRAVGVAYRLLSHRDDAMETVQDAFLKAYDRLSSLDEPSRFGPWFLRIVNNLSLNRRRGRALRKTASLDMSIGGDDDSGSMDRPDPHQPTPLEAVGASDLQQRINEALNELPPLQRQSLVMFSMEKIPQKQVAEILGCSVEAVKWHVFTARKKMKEALKDYMPQRKK